VSLRGTYALVLYLDGPQTVLVGALGKLTFPPGWYLYLGSARGPGGLAARLARHRRRTDKRYHWHIDYLRAVTKLMEVWTSTSEAQQECDWANAAAALPDARIITPRFGSSDCRCPSHLFHYAQRPGPSEFASLVQIELEGERTNAPMNVEVVAEQRV
jgi:Uri superfamily endonuclease